MISSGRSARGPTMLISPTQDVPELRQFINMSAAKDATHTCDAFIMFVGNLHLAILFRILAHGTEFVNVIQLATFT